VIIVTQTDRQVRRQELRRILCTYVNDILGVNVKLIHTVLHILMPIFVNVIIVLNFVGTILRRRKVRFTDDEILLILRAYLAHPSKWIDVIAEVKANQHVLDEHTRELYAHSSDKQLRERMSTKLHSLMSKNQNEFNNVDIR
jgi:hypothetical protein